MSVWTVGGAGVVGTLGFLGYGVGGLIGDSWELRYADMVGLITMVCIGALTVLYEYEKSGAPPEQHESAELADHDVDRITEEADEETTAEVNSFMVTGAIFQSRQQRVNGGDLGGVRRSMRRKSLAQQHVDDYPLIDYPSVESQQQAEQDPTKPRSIDTGMDDDSPFVAGTPIKAVACHPRFQEYAVLWNNSVVRTWSRSYSQDGSGQFSEKVVDLKDDVLRQRHLDAKCIGWSPVLPGCLAVGCRAGIMVWTRRDKTADFTLRVLNNNNGGGGGGGGSEAGVSALAWSPFGDLIAAAAAGSDVLQLWDVNANVCSTLKEWDGSPAIKYLVWSPGGNRLLVTTEGGTFRIWSAASSWKVEQQFDGAGPIVAAAWSRDGKELLFAEEGNSQIFSIMFHTGAPETPRPIYDTRKIGLAIADMAWDPANARLAVTFSVAADDANDATQRASNGVLIFATEEYGSGIAGTGSAPRSASNNHTKLRPCRLIHGPEGMRPEAVTFVHNRRSQLEPVRYQLKRDPFRGCPDIFAMLCITWGGQPDDEEKRNRVTFFPFIGESLRESYLD